MSLTSDAVTQHVEFLEHFKDMDDPRQAGKLLYPLDEVLLLCLCGVLCGADGWVAISLFGRKKLDFLRRFRPFKNGTPSDDELRYIFGRLDEEQFQHCFINWVASFQKAIKGVIAIDGKTLRRSFDKAGAKGAIHMVSAWSSEQNLVLGQTRVDEKSNEITAIPKLLDLLEIEGAIITIDAMGCQRDIAEKIRDKKADYIFALKGNQGKLHKDIAAFFKEEQRINSKIITKGYHQTDERNHGRLELRRVTVCTDIKTLKEKHKWPGLTSIIMVEYIASENGENRSETRYYISSLSKTAVFMAKAIRQHWGIENGLHWVMDVVFGDDDCRIRKDNAPANFATIKHMASNVLRSSKEKESMKSKRHMAAWDEDFLFELIIS